MIKLTKEILKFSLNFTSESLFKTHEHKSLNEARIYKTLQESSNQIKSYRFLR